jgi:hypothetical protein
MNKQAVGLSPPYLRYGRPQTPEEKAAVAARKVQRVVKKRLQRQAVAARKVQRETDREVKRAVTKTLDGRVAQLAKKEREVQREVKREVKKTLDGMVAQLAKEGANKRRWHNSACGVENKRRQSGRWQKNLYGHWEQWTER